MKVGVVRKSQTNLDNWFGENYLNQIINRNTPMPEEPAPASFQSTLHIPEGDDYAENAHLIDPYLLPYLLPLQQPVQTEYPATDPINPQRNPEHIFQIERLLDDSGFRFPLSENVPTEVPEDHSTGRKYGFGGVSSAQKDILEYLAGQEPYDDAQKNIDFIDYLYSMQKPGGSKLVQTPGNTLDKEKMHMMPDSFLDLMYPQSKLPEYDWGFQSERWLDDDGNPIPGAIPPVNALRLTDYDATRRMLQTRGGLVPKDSSFKDFESNLSSQHLPFYAGRENPAGGRGFFITTPDIRNVQEAVTPHQDYPIPVAIRGFRHDTGTGKTQSRPIAGQHENVTEALVGEHIPQERLVIPRIGNYMLTGSGYKSANHPSLMIPRMLRQGISPEQIASMYPQLKEYFTTLYNLENDNFNLDLPRDFALGLRDYGPLRSMMSELGSRVNEEPNAVNEITTDLRQQLQDMNDLSTLGHTSDPSRSLPMLNYTRAIDREKANEKQIPFSITENNQFLDLLNRINPPNFPEFYEGIVDDKTGMPIIGGKPIPMETLTKNPELIPAISKYYKELERLNRVTTPPSWGKRISQLEDLSETEKNAFRDFLGKNWATKLRS